jgi:hypothetical protein
MVGGEIVSLGFGVLHGLGSILDDENHDVPQTPTETRYLTISALTRKVLVHQPYVRAPRAWELDPT